mmetsp:Transcript_1157/g.1960  ORF Transcript_1157/g.1960 Transcript_1157/m.1960 type:complete len:219 (+) Transcript_1157:348-1004(+)
MIIIDVVYFVVHPLDTLWLHLQVSICLLLSYGIARPAYRLTYVGTSSCFESPCSNHVSLHLSEMYLSYPPSFQVHFFSSPFAFFLLSVDNICVGCYAVSAQSNMKGKQLHQQYDAAHVDQQKYCVNNCHQQPNIGTKPAIRMLQCSAPRAIPIHFPCILDEKGNNQPSQHSSPNKLHRQNAAHQPKEPFVIRSSHARVEPVAVMVKIFHALVAKFAMH